MSASPAIIRADVSVHIRCDPEIVFNYFADLRNEPEYNSLVSDVTKTSPGPIGTGTTFTGRHRGFGPVTWRLVTFEPPKRLVIDGVVGRGRYRWTSDLERTTEGTVLTGHMEWEPAGCLRWFRPLLRPLLSWRARRSFRRMAARLDEDAL
ncbi:MAG: SRPBCC family protein [Flavobacteriales bacterium]|nr:SRPBCC family protein [Flavobacteriales bacterium]MBP6698279.1 SRPBCC family protein [Flavobacteriales bacterium]